MPDKKLIIPKEIVCSDSKRQILKNHFIEIAGDKIVNIGIIEDSIIKNFSGQVVYANNLTVVPGFIQTHIHLCQTLFRGLADDLELLDWLQLKIFPFENAHSKSSLKASVRLGLNELICGGTTTILDMGTLRHQEVIFEELINSKIRAFAGKCMMDINDLFPNFKSSTKEEINSTYQLAKFFHKKTDKIKYGFAPRFVLSCSEDLLKETTEMMMDFDGSLIHTHASENKKEIQEVRKMHGVENIEYFNSINMLGPKTVLAHGIHLNDNEINIIKNKNVKISHCPSSNLKLASGIANIPRYLKEGINVSLGADGAPCNNELNIFTEMKLAALIQKPFHGSTSMNAETIFRMATIDAAEALGLRDEIGSIEIGKKADLVFLNLNDSSLPLDVDERNIYSTIVYSASKNNVVNVMIGGEWIVKNNSSLIYDQAELISFGKEELIKLISRV